MSRIKKGDGEETKAQGALSRLLVLRLIRSLQVRLPAGHCLQSKQPLTFADSEPEPDVSIIQGSVEDYRQSHPATAELVAEICVSSHDYDRDKLVAYAGAGVHEVWLEVVGNYAYVAARDAGWRGGSIDGLVVIDVSNPVSPLLVGYGLSNDANDAKVVGNYVYVADGWAELQILELKLGYAQTLELRLPVEIPFQSLPLPALASSTSELAVTFAVVDGPASILNNQLILNGVGPVTLRAEQAGNALYLPVSTEWTVTVTLPQLGVRFVEGQVEIFWSAGLTSLQLQVRESLTPESSWQDVTTVPAEVGGEVRIRPDSSSTYRYFRLLKP